MTSYSRYRLRRGESGYQRLMPIVTRCIVDGCETLTIGPLCVDHEIKTPRVFVRGRPLARNLAAARPTGANLDLSVRALPRPSSLAGVGLEVEPG
jgi:hypothetical protein